MRSEIAGGALRYNPLSEIAPIFEIEHLIGALGGFFYVCGYTRSWTDLYVSASIEGLTGHSRRDFEAGDVTFDQLFDPALAAQVRSDYSRQLVETGRYTIETVINAKDGSVRWVKDCGTLIRDGVNHYILGVCIDTSEVAWERHLRLRAERETESLTAFKSRAAGVIAHELRTPLNAVVGYIDFIKAAASALGEDKISSYADKADAGARQLVKIAESAVKYSSLGVSEAPAVNTTLLSLIRSAIVSIQSQGFNAPEIRLNELALGRTIVRGDRLALTGVFEELLENAAKHAGANTIVTIDAHIHPQGGAVVVVGDDGSGVDIDSYGDAVAPFVKPISRENTAAPGIGLGLPRVAATIEGIGGALYL
ncbi:MAG: PAS domain-containing sensor histidine kinase, partial [Pseudomonadota bacterium]